MKTLPICNKKAHILKENRVNFLPKNIIFYDSETKSIPIKLRKKTSDNKLVELTEEKLRLGYFEYWKNKFLLNYDFYYTKNEFFDIIKNYFLSLNENLYVIAHNQNFDFSCSLNLDFFKKDFVIKKDIINNNIFILIFQEKKPHMGNKKRSIIFLDSFNYIKSSIEEMGKHLNIDKIKIKDFSKVSKSKLKERCKTDVLILRKMFFELLDFCERNDIGKFAYTIAGLSFNCFRHKFMKENIFIHNDIHVSEMERMSYFGGRCECFKLGKYENVYKLDINSAYPYSMRENKYPIKLLSDTDKLIKKGFSKYTYIADVTINTKNNYYPFYLSKENITIFPTGKFRTILTKPEFELLTESEIVKIHEIIIYQNAFIFTDFVNYFYELRKKYSKENNEIFKYFCKIFLNSLYGKFGQRQEQYKRNPEYDNLFNVGMYEIDNDNKLTKLKFINGEAYEKIGTYEYVNNFIAIASFVTAYTRRNLLNYILKAKKENVYYCDTDSLFINEMGYKNLMKDINENELGKLKLEGKGNIEIRGLKDYTFNDENHIKGLKKDAIKIDNNNYIVERFLGYKEKFRFYTPDKVLKIKTPLHLNRKYRKGNIKNKNITPIILNNENIHEQFKRS